ncbi:MAG TPA: hypothetical protein VGJ48_05360, partial [Pyrinomonadaceae bacterium]
MGLFWKRKSGDQFVSLRLNEPLPEKTPETTTKAKSGDSPITPADSAAEAGSPTPIGEDRATPYDFPPSSAEAPLIEPVSTGAGPTPVPSESLRTKLPRDEPRRQTPPNEAEAGRPPITQQGPVAPVPSRSPFVTSVLGLNLSMEELQAQEAALEQEFSARFRRAVAATRES